MKKVAILALLALGLTISGCGNGISKYTTTTTAGGYWEAQFTGGIGPASLLTFVTQFNVTVTTGANAQPLDVTSFSFINAGTCFANGAKTSTETGSATLNASTTGAVTGSMTYTVTSVTNPGTTLTLTSNNGVTGTTNGVVGTNGTLSNGVVQGTWTLTSTSTGCNGGGDFLMCQGAATCTVP
ncbi:MAG TPA: hypothetical protein VJ999_04930 [Candidatus Sulfotelmatobacter sp.]|nr:hypothetical protein [Candidatus Sulfotelmatobacter sp.]